MKLNFNNVNLHQDKYISLMLLEFSVQNLLSFKDEQVFTMLAAAPFKEYMDTHTIEVGKTRLLKSSLIYGGNASGKSNLIKALRFMIRFVNESFKLATDEANPLKDIPKFALSTETEEDTVTFEAIFFVSGKRYRYGFELNTDKVVAEWLFHTTTKEVYLFKRTEAGIEINESSFKEAEGRKNDVRNNVLFLTYLASLKNTLISQEVFNWFKNIITTSSSSDDLYKNYTKSKLSTDPVFTQWVTDVLSELEIASIKVDDEQNSEETIDKILAKVKSEEEKELLTLMKKVGAKAEKTIRTIHHKYNTNNDLVDSVAFNLDNQESEGTRKLVYLLGPIYDTLINGKVLIVDEFDAKLHTILSQSLLSIFNSEQNKGAQLIATVHDTALMDKDNLRRDQIWFVEKDKYGASQLYSLAEFKSVEVRNTSAFNTKYLNGDFGSLLRFENLNFNPPFLYEQEKQTESSED